MSYFMTPAPPTSDGASQASFTGIEEPLSGAPTHGVARGVVPWGFDRSIRSVAALFVATDGPATGVTSPVDWTASARIVSRSVPAVHLLTVMDHALPPLLVEGAPIEQWSAEPVFVKSPAVSPETGLSNRTCQVNEDARVGPFGATIETRGLEPMRAVDP